MSGGLQRGDALAGQSREHRYGLSSILCKSERTEVDAFSNPTAQQCKTQDALIKMLPAFRIGFPLREHFPYLALWAYDDYRYRRMAEAVPESASASLADIVHMSVRNILGYTADTGSTQRGTPRLEHPALAASADYKRIGPIQRD